MQAPLGRSSTCRHASALLRAVEQLREAVRSSTLHDLFIAFPDLLGPPECREEGAPVGTITYYASNSGERNIVAVYAEFYNDVWTTVIVRRTANKFHLATCCQMRCQTRPWGCIHAKAVNKVMHTEASSAAVRAEMERIDELQFGPGALLKEENELQLRRSSEATPGCATPLPTTAPPPPLTRRERNMFPCPAEVAFFDSYSATLDRLRDDGKGRELVPVHCEETCWVCGLERQGKRVVGSLALYFTIRGRLQIFAGV